MKNESYWKTSKYRLEKDKLRASNDSSQVGFGSRLTVECIARFYNDAIPKYVKGKLIDLGCGQAPLFIKYRPYTSQVTCVDWVNTTHKNDYIDIECDLTKALPFEDGAFDTIILSDVLEHIPEPDLLWSEMARILSGGGILLMNVPFFYPLHELPYDYYRYSSYALKRFAEKNGFSVVQLDAIGGSPEVIADILCKHLQFIPIFGKVVCLFIQYLTSTFMKSNVGKNLSIKTSERYPLGYFMVAIKNII